MKVNIELTDKDIKELICKHLDNFYLGDFYERNVKIYVKSKQNTIAVIGKKRTSRSSITLNSEGTL